MWSSRVEFAQPNVNALGRDNIAWRVIIAGNGSNLIVNREPHIFTKNLLKLAATAARGSSVATLVLLTCSLSGCAVVAVTDAAVTTAATVVKAGASVAGAAADVARAGVKAVTGGDAQKK